MANSQIPSYSGVTINISNPTVNTTPYLNSSTPSIQGAVQTMPAIVTEPPQESIPQTPQTYPPQYYLNNYNYSQNLNNPPKPEIYQINQDKNKFNTAQKDPIQETKINQEADLSKSADIINNLDTKAAKEKELEETGKQTRITALTDEYIMSLENYLNNQNTEIRLMAAKEILTRFDEDKTRYDDAALNALLNKMLQDPQKLIRIAALSALSSGLASGNNYTVELLNNIQQNPNSDKEDVVEAANILLKMSSETKIQYSPNDKTSNEQKA